MRLKDLSSYPARERLARRVLGLPAQAPDPLAMKFVPVENSDLLAVEQADEAERARQTAAWHAEDRRADLAYFLARLPQRGQSMWHTLTGELYVRRAERALSRARRLRYTSRYIHPRSGTINVEGYFDLPGELAFPVEIVAAEAAGGYAREEWEYGSFIGSAGNLLACGTYIWVPAAELTEDLIREALERFLAERYRFQRGHWTQREGRLPTVDIDLEWSDEGLPGSPSCQALKV